MSPSLHFMLNFKVVNVRSWSTVACILRYPCRWRRCTLRRSMTLCTSRTTPTPHSRSDRWSSGPLLFCTSWVSVRLIEKTFDELASWWRFGTNLMLIADPDPVFGSKINADKIYADERVLRAGSRLKWLAQSKNLYSVGYVNIFIFCT